MHTTKRCFLCALLSLVKTPAFVFRTEQGVWNLQEKELLLFHVEMLPSRSSSYSQVWRVYVFLGWRGKRTRRTGKMKAILGPGNWTVSASREPANQNEILENIRTNYLIVFPAAHRWLQCSQNSHAAILTLLLNQTVKQHLRVFRRANKALGCLEGKHLTLLWTEPWKQFVETKSRTVWVTLAGPR